MQMVGLFLLVETYLKLRQSKRIGIRFSAFVFLRRLHTAILEEITNCAGRSEACRRFLYVRLCSSVWVMPLCDFQNSKTCLETSRYSEHSLDSSAFLEPVSSSGLSWIALFCSMFHGAGGFSGLNGLRESSLPVFVSKLCAAPPLPEGRGVRRAEVT